MSSKKGDEYPLRFWLLSSLKALTELDCDEGEYLLELAFENEVVILKFSSSSDLKRWLILLKKAKDFQPSTYFSGESVSDVKDTLLALDASTVIAFSLDEDGKIVRHDLLIISNIVDIKLKISKPECSLVRLFLIKKIGQLLSREHFLSDHTKRLFTNTMEDGVQRLQLLWRVYTTHPEAVEKQLTLLSRFLNYHNLKIHTIYLTPNKRPSNPKSKHLPLKGKDSNSIQALKPTCSQSAGILYCLLMKQENRI